MVTESKTKDGNRHVAISIDQHRFEQYRLLSAREGRPLSHIITDLLDNAVIDNLTKEKVNGETGKDD